MACLWSGILAITTVGLAAPSGSPSDPPSGATQHSESQVRTDARGDRLPDQALSRLGTIRFCYGARPAGDCFIFSADGSRLMAPCVDGTIRFWETATGVQSLRLINTGHLVVVSALSSNGEMLAAAHDTGVSVRDLRKRKTMHGWGRLDGIIECVAFAPDNRTLLAASGSGTIYKWDLQSGNLLHQFTCQPSRLGARSAFSPDAKQLAIGNGNTLELWDLRTETLSRQFQGFSRTPGSTVFSPNGALIANKGASEYTVRVWDAQTGAALAVLNAHEATPGFSPDNKQLASVIGTQESGIGFLIRFSDPHTGDLLNLIPRADLQGIAQVTFSPNGRLLASAGLNSIRLWDAQTHAEVSPSAEHPGSVIASAFAPDGQTIATAGLDGVVRLWAPRTGAMLRCWTTRQKWLEALVFTPDGQTLITGGDGTVCGWKVANGLPLFRIKGFHDWSTDDPERSLKMPLPEPAYEPDHMMGSVAVAPNGKLMAAGDQSAVRIWDMTTHQELTPLVTATQNNCVTFSADSKILATASFNEEATNSFVHVYDVSSRKSLWQKELDQQRPDSIAFSPDGTVLAIGFVHGGVLLLDGHSGQALEGVGLSADRGVRAIAFSPDGRSLAVSRRDSWLQIFERATGADRLHLYGPEYQQGSIGFSPDGKFIVTGGSNGTALVWDLFGRVNDPSWLAGWRAEHSTDLWQQLGSTNAATGYRAMVALMHEPDRAVTLLKEHLHPLKEPVPHHLRRLIADLDSDQFDRRKQAFEELQWLRDLAAPFLQEARTGHLSPEKQRRVSELLKDEKAPWKTPQGLQALRGIEVLEQIASAPARALLTELSKGTPASWQTQEAAASLNRLRK